VPTRWQTKGFPDARKRAGKRRTATSYAAWTRATSAGGHDDSASWERSWTIV
jgi:hypothetical protein